MKPEDIVEVLEKYKKGELTLDESMSELKDLPYKSMDFAHLDNHRQLRVGYPEVVYCAGKSIEQLKGIMHYLVSKNSSILATRASEDQFEAVKEFDGGLIYNKISRTITLSRGEPKKLKSYIAVVTAGTSDIPVAEEAAVTAEIFGNKVERIFDVGVAGIHRLFSRIDLIRGAKVIVAVAGMEGALPSVLGGLVDKPIIAVPTSVGYGANFGGLSALLTMLNSCAGGVSVVNIDNGFGGGYIASMINSL
ncbi:MAG TPA: nickel pincer cofactor biosynthesis protein LarB [Spirochaetota bacterium]